MKISEHFLTIPPYLSVKWEDIRSLLGEGDHLIVILSSNQRVEIPSLTRKEREEIFLAHQRYLEKMEDGETRSAPSLGGNLLNENILKISINSLQQMSSFLQHNSAKAHSPDLPKEVKEKVADMARMFSSGDGDLLPKSEPHCNCPYCQIARVIHEQGEKNERGDSHLVEEVCDKELRFNDWHVERVEDRLYRVTSKLDETVSYQVFLGTPVGCTCGESGCSHLLAVLRD